VQVFVPSEGAPCLECAWDAHDYELVEQNYPCQDAAAPAETMATSELGALAAALLAIECRKLLDNREGLLADRDLLIDAHHHRHYVTSFQRSASCRMPDHAGWSIERRDMDPASTTLGELMETHAGAAPAGAAFRRPSSIRVAGQQFAVAQECRQCRERQPAGYVHRGGRRQSIEHCPRCNSDRFVSGFDLRDEVTFDDLPIAARNRSLLELGVLPGDVVTLRNGDVDVHLELGGASWLIEF
jgi:hypothetical protein